MRDHQGTVSPFSILVKRLQGVQGRTGGPDRCIPIPLQYRESKAGHRGDGVIEVDEIKELNFRKSNFS